VVVLVICGCDCAVPPVTCERIVDAYNKHLDEPEAASSEFHPEEKKETWIDRIAQGLSKNPRLSSQQPYRNFFPGKTSGCRVKEQLNQALYKADMGVIR